MSGGSHAALSIVGGKYGVVEITYVVSYENFGIALAWLDSSKSNNNEELCRQIKSVYAKSPEGIDQLSAIWGTKASVPTVSILTSRITEGDKRVLHICLTPRAEDRQGKDNKFKLLGVRVF